MECITQVMFDSQGKLSTNLSRQGLANDSLGIQLADKGRLICEFVNFNMFNLLVEK